MGPDIVIEIDIDLDIDIDIDLDSPRQFLTFPIIQIIKD